MQISPPTHPDRQTDMQMQCDPISSKFRYFAHFKLE